MTKTYAFNLTFTRPDEGDANVYRCGINVLAKDRAEADLKVRERNDHLTLVRVSLFAVMDDDGEIVEAETHPARAAKINQYRGEFDRVGQAKSVRLGRLAIRGLGYSCHDFNRGYLKHHRLGVILGLRAA